MSRLSKSALLEQEQAVRNSIAAEQKAAEDARLAAEKQRESERQARLDLERRSCWCGIDHATGKRLTEERVRPSAKPLSAPSSRVFVGNLPFDWTEREIQAAMDGLLGPVRFRLVKESPPSTDAIDERDDWFLDVDHRWNSRPVYQTQRTHKGIGFIHCGSQAQAQAFIAKLQSHELIGKRGRKFAIRADFAKPQPSRDHRPSLEDVRAYYGAKP